ncbi:MAG: MBL fold metallo-hydrolase [Chloroflexota bacterium]
MNHVKSLCLMSVIGLILLAACVPVVPSPAASTSDMDDVAESMMPQISMRESGLQASVQDLGEVTVHSLTAPEPVFANSTHIFETPNSLVLIDTQFLLPLALDYRAYADSLGKPIERLIITHEHPDHFLGSEAFADVQIYALAEVADAIAANGQAEVDEKQADFGDTIASTFVVPEILEPGSVQIDGITFIFEVVEDAEAEIQVVTKVPEYGVVSVGDIVYSGVHLILAGSPPTWTEALEALKAESADYPVVLAGHGLPGGPDLYDQNIAWLAKAAELMGTATSGEEFKAGLVEAFPELGMDAAIDFILPFLFSNTEGESTVGLIEVITVALADGATAEDFLPTDQVIKDGYASQQPGYLARETAVSEDGLVRLSVHWESKADSDASIAGFGEAPGLEAFMSNLNPETMVIKQYELLSSTSRQVMFPGAGVTEAITVKLQDGADADGFLAANKAIEENHIMKQPGFIAREVGVTEDGEWLIVIHWETAEDSATSIAKFGEAPGAEVFMAFLDVESMSITVYDIQQ